MRKTKFTVGVVTLAVGAVVMLSGCSAVEDALQKEQSATYADLSAFLADSDIDAPWLPQDGTEIAVIRSTQASDAAISLASSADLSPDLCAEVDRQSAPAYQPGPEVDVFTIEEAFACGNWTVVRTDDGWLGWTPGDPDEKAQSPS